MDTLAVLEPLAATVRDSNPVEYAERLAAHEAELDAIQRLDREVVDLPLFCCGPGSFEQASLRLYHMFEPRYRWLVERALATPERAFGVIDGFRIAAGARGREAIILESAPNGGAGRAVSIKVVGHRAFTVREVFSEGVPNQPRAPHLMLGRISYDDEAPLQPLPNPAVSPILAMRSAQGGSAGTMIMLFSSWRRLPSQRALVTLSMFEPRDLLMLSRLCAQSPEPCRLFGMVHGEPRAGCTVRLVKLIQCAIGSTTAHAVVQAMRSCRAMSVTDELIPQLGVALDPGRSPLCWAEVDTAELLRAEAAGRRASADGQDAAHGGKCGFLCSGR
jgi:hypothetical protein